MAIVGDATISAEALEQELLKRGGQPDKQQVLKEMIRFQTLLAKAKAAGYEGNPELLAAWERMLVARFQEDQLSARESVAGALTDSEVQTRYEQNLSRYTSPGMVRAGVILLKSGAKAEPDRKAALARQAAAVRAEAAQTNAAGFAELARKCSEDQATRYLGGDTGWLRSGMASAHWEPGVIEAASALISPGDLSPVLATAKGFYVVRLNERKPAAVAPLDQVREAIRYELTREKLWTRQRNFFEEMKSGLRIEINQTLLDAITAPGAAAEPKPPALPGG